MADVPTIDIDELARVRGQVPLIDVRNPDEYEEAHVPSAVLVPLGDLDQRLDDVPDGTVYVICKSGGRSLKACEFLRERGHDAVNVTGGTMAWIEAGHEVTTGGEAS